MVDLPPPRGLAGLRLVQEIGDLRARIVGDQIGQRRPRQAPPTSLAKSASAKATSRMTPSLSMTSDTSAEAARSAPAVAASRGPRFALASENCPLVG